MVGVLILTHGGLATELLAAARTIAGDLPGFAALPLAWGDDLDHARAKVEKAIAALDDGDGVLILTDIFGGTPTNVAMSFRLTRQVEVVSGVNLPMVVRLGCLGKRSLALAEMAAWIRTKGRASICAGTDLPGGHHAPPEPCDDEEG